MDVLLGDVAGRECNKFFQAASVQSEFDRGRLEEDNFVCYVIISGELGTNHLRDGSITFIIDFIADTHIASPPFFGNLLIF